mmetsp:Transcript_17510/g.44617  ORF Transcript_17510/g.44617 Transcript_17510/m.44617 type:complete len:232 (+) Transcript_17510:640-1335(+)
MLQHGNGNNVVLRQTSSPSFLLLDVLRVHQCYCCVIELRHSKDNLFNCMLHLSPLRVWVLKNSGIDVQSNVLHLEVRAFLRGRGGGRGCRGGRRCGSCSCCRRRHPSGALDVSIDHHELALEPESREMLFHRDLNRSGSATVLQNVEQRSERLVSGHLEIQLHYDDPVNAVGWVALAGLAGVDVMDFDRSRLRPENFTNSFLSAHGKKYVTLRHCSTRLCVHHNQCYTFHF